MCFIRRKSQWNSGKAVHDSGSEYYSAEVDGTFDDCQALVKNAFMDADLNAHMKLTSANSINVARFLPQAFYYFYAYAQLKKEGKGGSSGSMRT